jgi:hypothetical protein
MEVCGICAGEDWKKLCLNATTSKNAAISKDCSARFQYNNMGDGLIERRMKFYLLFLSEFLFN